MTKRRKVNNPTQPYIEQLADDNEEYMQHEMKEVYKENKKQRDKLIKVVIGIYTTYTIAKDVSLKTSDSRKIKAEFANSLTNIGLKVGKKEESVITKGLKGVANESHNRTNFIIQAGYSRDLKFSKLKAETIDRIIEHRINRQTFSDRIWKNQAKLISTLDKELKQAIKTGKSVDKVARAIKNRFAVKTYEAMRVSRTETGYVHSEISRQVYRDSEVVKKVQWVSELLDNTDPYDASLHGQTWDADGNHPIPIANTHPDCLCEIIPVIAGWKAPKNFNKEYNIWQKSKGL